MGKKQKKDDEIKIANWEYVEPLILIKAIDETMEILELKLKDNSDELIEYIYNLHFLVRSNLLMIMTLIKLLNKKDDVENIIKKGCDSFYT